MCKLGWGSSGEGDGECGRSPYIYRGGRLGVVSRSRIAPIGRQLLDGRLVSAEPIRSIEDLGLVHGHKICLIMPAERGLIKIATLADQAAVPFADTLRPIQERAPEKGA